MCLTDNVIIGVTFKRGLAVVVALVCLQISLGHIIVAQKG
jgi:hypothetical protein